MASASTDPKKNDDAVPEAKPFLLPAPLCGVIGLAMLAGLLYLNDFGAGAFAPHKVPPPANAGPNDVTVQFCQA
jgi:hypothetical protein